MKRFFRALFIISFLSCLGGESIAQTKTTSKKPTQKKISNPATSSNATLCPKENKTIPVKASEIDKPLKIISKPRAALTTNANVQGVVRLRVTFLYCGKIGEISPVSRLPNGLTESAIEAARKIRFEPAMKNGKPVNVTKIVEYTFTLY
jgi:outer membrane biosynthesis protein TonB